MKNLLYGFLVLVWTLPQPARAGSSPAPDIEVQVTTAGEELQIDVGLEIAAPPRLVWAVFTDYEHMTDILSNLKVSKVLARRGNVLEVYQQGRAEHGLLSYSFESTREFRLTPYRKIEFRLLKGTMRKMEGRLLLQARGAGTHVQFHVDTIPDVFLPPVLGKAFVEHETREQFGQWRDEVLRRAAARPSKPRQ
jgi:uncharacterized protein YndB with AHSA1/START domain